MKIIISILFLILTSGIIAQPEIPLVKNYANDYTNTLSPEQLANINRALINFEDSTSTQIVFLMISSLQNYPLEMYTFEAAEKNKIGTKENSNGLLFFIAKEDKKMRIETGYGLEGALPDALASSILRNEVRPYFQKGDYYSGIVSGLNAILAATVGEYKQDTRSNDDGDEKGFPLVYIIIFILMFLFGRGRRGGILPFIFLGGLGGGRSGGFGSGGFGGSSGGGFGGFSGGGGGFGGGGASGSW